MQTKLSDGSVMISGFLGKDAEYKQEGDKRFNKNDGTQGACLECEGVFIQPPTREAPQQQALHGVDGYEQQLTDDGVPF